MDTLNMDTRDEVVCLEHMIQQIMDWKDELFAQAKFKCDSYWTEWKNENTRISAMKQVVGSNTYVHTGRLAPRVYSPNNTPRVYIEWWDFKKHSMRKVVRSYGVRIQPIQKGYTWNTVKKRANSWERTLFEKYEPEFNILRLTIDAACNQIAYLKKTLKKIKSQIAEE